jgi:hypothetical protein
MIMLIKKKPPPTADDEYSYEPTDQPTNQPTNQPSLPHTPPFPLSFFFAPPQHHPQHHQQRQVTKEMENYMALLVKIKGMMEAKHPVRTGEWSSSEVENINEKLKDLITTKCVRLEG